MKFAILITEKEETARRRIKSLLRSIHYPITIIEDLDTALAGGAIDIVIAGLSGSSETEGDSLKEQMETVRLVSPGAQLILCSPAGLANLDKLVMDLQARSFLLKPLDKESFAALLEKTLSIIRKRKIRKSYDQSARRTSHLAEIIGRSTSMREVLALLKKVSESNNTSILLLGESGTGKSLFAKSIHDMSGRASGPFIEVNCAALPPALLESELFGYEPGAFTDAKNEKMGLIELADGGTFFMDEITEVEIATQAKLLKFLDTKRIRRLGGGGDIKVDVRVVVASNRNIRHEIRNRRFREDLYYRLNVVSITIPPLRERREDIEPIADYYINEFKNNFHKSNLNFTNAALDLMKSYTWPGNIRELINMIERAVLLARGNEITPADLSLPVKYIPKQVSITSPGDSVAVNLPPGGVNLEALEKAVIEEALKFTRGNVLKTSTMLGLSRGALRYKISKHGINPRAFAAGSNGGEPVTSDTVCK